MPEYEVLKDRMEVYNFLMELQIVVSYAKLGTYQNGAVMSVDVVWLQSHSGMLGWGQSCLMIEDDGKDNNWSQSTFFEDVGAKFTS